MAFWSIVSNFEPLRQNRWYISFGDDEFQWALKECSKPEYEVSFTEHRLLTQTFKYPGLLKWKPVTIKLASTVDESKGTLDKFMQKLSTDSGYKVPTGGGHQQIYKDGLSNNKILNLTITQINQHGDSVEEWVLNNCFISSVNYGALTYGAEEIVEISLTIQYDWASQDDKNIKQRQEKTNTIEDTKTPTINSRSDILPEYPREDTSDLLRKPLIPSTAPEASTLKTVQTSTNIPENDTSGLLTAPLVVPKQTSEAQRIISSPPASGTPVSETSATTISPSLVRQETSEEQLKREQGFDRSSGRTTKVTTTDTAGNTTVRYVTADEAKKTKRSNKRRFCIKFFRKSLRGVR